MYKIDTEYTKECFRELIDVPSTSGYYVRMQPAFEQCASKIGYEVTKDNKGTQYITVEGQDNSKTVEVFAHLDTIGLIVRAIEDDGTLRVRQIGGVNYSTLDGENVTVLTRDGKAYSGLLLNQYHSVHVFKDVARETVRTEANMMVLLDEHVESRKDVEALGICKGDYVDVKPRWEFTEKGFLKSRYIDDKACVACAMTALKYMKETGSKPLYRTIFAFPYGEEIGLGGNYVPSEVSEILAMDCGLIGPGYDGSEYKVSICTKDASVVYDYEMTSRLVELAKKNGINYALDVYFNYGSDAGEALKCGSNTKIGLIGMGVHGTHGMERTHMDGINSTTQLLLSYLLEK